ncbi:L-alanine-DL-glutamate epimerase-like enolase superfamily enzyme [Kribbella amoyensis]|uniref:L-alanine-DL-glutamate epimerase-like enolase superfamily enzyme n=1 Tax=Kribbella amoyensis TaxID=996641 RepID=A0A561B7C8_9ACTN|nr:mandelate racemase/muconate lactonizing enzyme family protein [Kribbella amoyensis]TWD74730.1 L-alanine-DL-glutamate epimerase-like enolase superfamily enzyme [Kribbella amoyensis]
MTSADEAQQHAPDRIARVRVSQIRVPLARPASDAKVLTGRQRPIADVPVTLVELTTADGAQGLGFGYCLRVGGPALYAHTAELAAELIGQDPADIAAIWEHLVWQGASAGRSGLAVQAVGAIDTALWDLKARRAGLPLSRLIGRHHDSVRTYNTSGGYLSTPTDQMLVNASAAVEAGIGGIKVKVGQPDAAADLDRVRRMRDHLPAGIELMVDANQQWDRPTAIRMGRELEPLGLTWIEEPLDAYDHPGHARLAEALDTPIATGEMLACLRDHEDLFAAGGVDVLQADAPRIGGITPYLRVMDLAARQHARLAPHFVMEIHLHLAACFPTEPYVEHFDWLEPLFEERLEISAGRMHVPDRPGLGFTVSADARTWTVAATDIR